MFVSKPEHFQTAVKRTKYGQTFAQDAEPCYSDPTVAGIGPKSERLNPKNLVCRFEDLRADAGFLDLSGSGSIFH